MTKLPLSGWAEEVTLSEPATGGAPSISLNDVLEMAEQRNPSLVAAQVAISISHADVRIAGERPNPQINGYLGYGDTTNVLGNPQQIALSQLIETANKRKKRIKVAEAQQSLTQAQVEGLRWDIRNQTRLAYTDVAVAEANAKLVQSQVNLLQQLVDIAQKRFDAGASPQAEVFQARLLQAHLKTRVVETDSEIRQAKDRLNALLGNALPTDFKILDNLLEIHVLRTDLLPGPAQSLPPLDKLVALAYEHRPDLQAAALQQKVAQNQITLEKSRRIPDLQVSQGFMYIGLPKKYSPSRQDQAFTGGFTALTVELPIFHHQQAEIAKAEAQQMQAEAQHQAIQVQIAEDVSLAYQALQANLENLHRYQSELMPDSKKVLSLAQISYQYGKTGLANVILAEQADQSIRQDYLDTIAAYQRNWVTLEKAVGEGISP